MLSHALEARMKDLMERLVSINHHRLDLRKQDDQVDCWILAILTIVLSVCLSVCLAVCPSVCPFVCSSVCPSVHLFVPLFVSHAFYGCSLLCPVAT